MENSAIRYAPKGKPAPVVKPGEFIFSAIALDHGHVNCMCDGLIEAGGTLKYVYDPDAKKVETFLGQFPQAIAAESEQQVLNDSDTRLVASAAVTNQRCALGLRVMDAGKDYFTDKAPLTSLEQLDAAKRKVKETGRKYAVYYSERLHVEGAVFAGDLIDQGAIGTVLQVIGLGPHRLHADIRPQWFFEKEQYGGILCDIGSHQIEQYLHFAGVKAAEVKTSQIANYAHPEYPELDDFGDALLVGANGTTNYFRVDWFTPKKLKAFGDGRTLILGTNGYIEIRKYADIGTGAEGGNHVILVNDEQETHFEVSGRVGFPYFGQLILDCIHRTENAMTQTHAFLAAELCVRAQMQAQPLALSTNKGTNYNA